MFLSQVSFNSGELDPGLNARALDVDKTKRALSLAENITPHVHGMFKRRPGTIFAGLARYNDRPCRMVKFNYSSSVSYILEVGDFYIRFWRDSAQVEAQVMQNQAPYQIDTPYPVDQIFTLDLKQVNDVMIITHPEHQPHILTREKTAPDPEEWSVNPIDYSAEGNYPPMLDENVDTDNYFELDAVTGTGMEPGDQVQITAQVPTFLNPEHIGSFWEISHARTVEESQVVWENLGTNKNGTYSDPLLVEGPWSFVTYGASSAVFAGTLVIQRSFDGKETWEDYRSYFNDPALPGAARVNYSDSGDEPTAVWYRIGLTGSDLGNSIANSARLACDTASVTGLVKIIAILSEYIALGEVITPLFSLRDTDRWAEGAWSDARGYPTASTLHELRLVYGGTPSQPTRIFGSATDDFFNHKLGVNDSDAWTYLIGAGEQNEIRSMISSKSLLIMTSGGEWVATGTGNEPITPSNIRIRRHSNMGSADLQGIMVDNVALFVQRGARRVQEYSYNWSEENYNAVDLTRLAEQVTEGQVVSWDHQRNRDSMVWLTNGNGEISAMTYERNEQVFGWHRHVTAGNFESVAVIYGMNEEDEVWVSVERELNGQTVRTVEYFDPDSWRKFDTGMRKEFHHVDCGVIYDNVPTTVITGLGHLEGETVQIWADGDAYGDQVVTGGQITLEYEVSRCSVGLGYRSIGVTFPLELGMRDGASLGRYKQMPRATVKLMNSTIAEVARSADAPKWELLDLRRLGPEGPGPDEGTYLFTGDYETQVPGGHEKELTFAIRSVGPSPFALLGVSMETEITKR